MEFDLGVHAGHFLSMKGGLGTIQENVFLGVKKNCIAEILPFQAVHPSRCRAFIEAGNQIVMPGLINGHAHLAMSLFRGFEDDVNFHKWLFDRIFPAEKKLVNEDFVRIGTELSILECIRFGTTTVNDMYFYADTSADALDRGGLRATVAWPFMDAPTPEEVNLGGQAVAKRLERFQEFYKRYQHHPRIRPALGPHAPYTCSDDLILNVTSLSHQYGIPVHMHLCETKIEVENSLQQHGKTPVERMNDLGALHTNLIAAHCVHFNDEDLECFRKSGASMIYNPDSNMKLGSGVAPIPAYRGRGINVGIGSDGAASNNDLSLFGAMDLGTKVQKGVSGENTKMVALDALNLATLEGARALGLEKQIGSLEVGKMADFICLRTDLPHVTPLHSVLSQLVYSYQGMEVDTVVCDGKLLLYRGEFKVLDPAQIYSNARAYPSQLKQLNLNS